MLRTTDLFSLKHNPAGEYIRSYEYPWQTIVKIGEIIGRLMKKLSKSEFEEISSGVWVHRSAEIAPTAYIGGPTIIGADTQVRHCAYIRGNALVGKGCVIGNSTEIKNVIMSDCVQIPHFNYVGDSILGYKAHLGAGAVTSNVRSDKGLVCVCCEGKRVDTGLKKLGAMVGDEVEVGCGSVLNPGSVIGRNSIIYPLSSVRGFVPENSIYKDEGNIVIRACKGG